MIDSALPSSEKQNLAYFHNSLGVRKYRIVLHVFRFPQVLFKSINFVDAIIKLLPIYGQDK